MAIISPRAKGVNLAIRDLIQGVTHRAERAIYIDFECLKDTPPRPALLGVLFGGAGEDLQQVITDARLAPARVANPQRLVVASAADAVATLVGMALAEDAMIVGWSDFDRERMHDACPALAKDIDSRYLNALQIARPWRHAVHPHVVIEREDAHAPKHTLDAYARLTAYPHVRRFAGAQPARWIRHTISQIAANDGDYRRTTRQTRRDWHDLLEYNRHDLLALRHIVEKAGRELAAWRAYERTRFCVDDGPRRVCFKAGSRSPRLAALLERHDADRWAFITAWNPGSTPLPPAENRRRQAKLRAVVRERGWKALPGEGVGEDASWTPEESLMILAIDEPAAVDLGRAFGQLAIVTGRRGGAPRLVPCT